jgi:hypothetical protein
MQRSAIGALMLRSGFEPQSLVSFKKLYGLKPKSLHTHLKHYPTGVRETVAQIMQNELMR